MTDPRMRRFALPVAAFAAMMAVVLCTGAVLFARKIGFDPSRVRDFYLGSEAAFTQPRSMAGLLEVAVPHLLAVPMAVFVTLHLVAFATGAARRPFARVSAVTWGFVLAGIGSGFAIRFAWPGLAPLKVAAFVGTEALLGWWLALLALTLLPPQAAPGRVTGTADAPPRAAR
ncbi:MAG TPA: hypothetical protein VFM53_01025 [Anaeromyxobacteraceae bacterium]|nr:hypothetical protein [Anaeromyxobacteraceae bacterium]